MLVQWLMKEDQPVHLARINLGRQHLFPRTRGVPWAEVSGCLRPRCSNAGWRPRYGDWWGHSG